MRSPPDRRDRRPRSSPRRPAGSCSQPGSGSRPVRGRKPRHRCTSRPHPGPTPRRSHPTRRRRRRRCRSRSSRCRRGYSPDPSGSRTGSRSASRRTGPARRSCSSNRRSSGRRRRRPLHSRRRRSWRLASGNWHGRGCTSMCRRHPSMRATPFPGSSTPVRKRRSATPKCWCSSRSRSRSSRRSRRNSRCSRCCTSRRSRSRRR